MKEDGEKDVIDLTGAEKTTGAKKKNNAAGMKEKPNSKQPAKNNFKSAAAINAGKAATSRHEHNRFAATNQTLDQTHPVIQPPEKMSKKSKEDQIIRCVNWLKPHVMDVDTLLRVLTPVCGSPDNPKFGIID